MQLHGPTNLLAARDLAENFLPPTFEGTLTYPPWNSVVGTVACKSNATRDRMNLHLRRRATKTDSCRYRCPIVPPRSSRHQACSGFSACLLRCLYLRYSCYSYIISFANCCFFLPPTNKACLQLGAKYEISSAVESSSAPQRSLCVSSLSFF
jgi:hypothetical protein